MRKAVYFIFLFLLVLCLGYSCFNDREEEVEKSKYLNHDKSVTYVGKETCRGCHPDIYATFSETGMGKSWGLANHNKSSGKFNSKALVYDTARNLYYHPQWQGDTLQLIEFRLDKKDTIFKRIETIKYIVGSGQHTNSHIYEVNGFLYQAPLTFYTQKGEWDLPPGFEGGNNTRFSRAIELECISCHNAFPSFDEQGENHYNKVELGLSCERCHGPGSLHVEEKRKGNLVDIHKEIDYTIVNPSKLSWQLQIDVCQRCHLQGNAVLKEGKSFFDFRPGMKLSSVEDVYMPRFTGDDSKFIMASHAERLQKSACFIQSNQQQSGNPKMLSLTCVTCHNPHISVKVTGKEIFNNACKNCHADNSCKAPVAEIHKENNNCVKCHMPMNGTIDIPHVTVHDHYIRKPMAEATHASKQQFAGITCVNNPSPDAASRAEGYLNYYEKFDPSRSICLDSAFFYLKQCENKELWIHYYYLKLEYSKVKEYAIKLQINEIHDAWTCYRIAESFMNQNDFNAAESWMDRTIMLKPKDLNFLLKQGKLKYTLGKKEEAKTIFELILQYNPKYAEAWNSLGLIICDKGKGDIQKAMACYDSALALDPDLESALINSLDIFNATGDKDKFLKYLKRLYRINPKNEKLVPMFTQFEIH